MEVIVGRIGRPHGIKGEVSIEVRTDDPEGRLAPGTVLRTDPEAAGPLTITLPDRSVILLKKSSRAAALVAEPSVNVVELAALVPLAEKVTGAGGVPTADQV